MTNEQILQLASAAGDAAFHNALPDPMVVVDGVKRYVVEGGACGFAWVKIKGNTPFGRFCKAKGIARKSYTGGLHIWCSHPSQSYDRKMAWASAFARVLNDNGIDAFGDGRLD